MSVPRFDWTSWYGFASLERGTPTHGSQEGLTDRGFITVLSFSLVYENYQITTGDSCDVHSSHKYPPRSHVYSWLRVFRLI